MSVVFSDVGWSAVKMWQVGSGRCPVWLHHTLCVWVHYWSRHCELPSSYYVAVLIGYIKGLASLFVRLSVKVWLVGSDQCSVCLVCLTLKDICRQMDWTYSSYADRCFAAAGPKLW